VKPIVTVLVDTYNHERFIEQALQSVVEQDFPPADMEILVVDDGSTDRTPDLVRQFEPRVRLLRKKNGGQASAFNAGIPEARGEIVAFLDGDDWWARNKSSRVVETMANDPSLGIVGHGITTVHRDGREEIETLREGFRFRADTLDGVRLFRRRGAFLGTSRMAIRADLLRRIGPVPEAIAVQADEYLFTLAAVLTYAHIIPESLTYYRMHDANAFQLSTYDPEKMRRKQAALALLAFKLLEQFHRFDLDSTVGRELTEFTRLTADQLHLMLDGGWPWETVKTEWRIYSVLHPDANILSHIFKLLTLFGALAMPPRWYFAVRRRVVQSGFYLRARQRYLPIPKMLHIQREFRMRS
jgi:glycosyltransferase involved in cell wall biosynthesis